MAPIKPATPKPKRTPDSWRWILVPVANVTRPADYPANPLEYRWDELIRLGEIKTSTPASRSKGSD